MALPPDAQCAISAQLLETVPVSVSETVPDVQMSVSETVWGAQVGAT